MEELETKIQEFEEEIKIKTEAYDALLKENNELKDKINELNDIILKANDSFKEQLASLNSKHLEELQERNDLITQLMTSTDTANVETSSFVDKINARRVYHSYD